MPAGSGTTYGGFGAGRCTPAPAFAHELAHPSSAADGSCSRLAVDDGLAAFPPPPVGVDVDVALGLAVGSGLGDVLVGDGSVGVGSGDGSVGSGVGVALGSLEGVGSDW